MPTAAHAPNCQCCAAGPPPEHEFNLVHTECRNDGSTLNALRCARCHSAAIEIQPARGKTTRRLVNGCAGLLAPTPTEK